MSKKDSNKFAVVSAAAAAAIVPLVVNVLYPAICLAGNAFQEKAPTMTMRIEYLAATLGYDVVNDDIHVKSWLAAVSGYWIMGLVCTTLDLFPKRFLHLKTQGSRSYFSLMEWMEAVTVSMLNITIIGWVVALGNWWLVKQLYGDRRLLESSEWAWPREIPKLFVCLLVVDVWFYWTHRAIHHPTLYKPIHKFHHRFKAPTAVASMYANPLEYAVGNQLGVVLGPLLSNAHPYTCYFWLAFALISTGGSHSGYTLFGATHHDLHHELFHYNFGAGLNIMDKLCGTEYKGSELWKKRRQTTAKNGIKKST
eukprot:CFRG6886T1